VILYPAIDIMDGRAVRLVRGDFGASKVYDADPLEAARRWVGEGAERLHVVDLDGARGGAPANLEHVRRIAAELDVPVQLGGGLRSPAAIAAAFEAGAARVILGTAALSDPELLASALHAHGAERVMVSVDARGGRVVTEGWQTASEARVTELVGALLRRGVRELLYTDVDRDGMLGGVGEREIEAVARAAGEAHLIYSGGIGALADLSRLAALDAPALAGVIVGKALYEGRFTVAQALAALAPVRPGDAGRASRGGGHA
jgi:phosphoribosylformimino-5-aminoimidazole carboxamide ribotide isomerase